MRITFFKYFTKEIWAIFFVSLFIFTFIIMATRIMGITELLINQRVNPSQIMKLLLCLLPRIVFFSLPASCLMCILLTFMRLSSDNEVIAMNASGISLYQMLPPVITFSILSYFMASVIALYGIPWGNRSYKDVLLQIAESRAEVPIKERIFFEPFDGYVFFINSYSTSDRIMRDLFVVVKREVPTTITIVAKRGRFISGQGFGMVSVQFEDGTIFTVDEDFKAARTIEFDTYTLNIDLKEIISSISSREKAAKEMYPDELINGLKNTPKEKMKYHQMEIKLYEMFSIPMAIFFMGIIGAPLGANIRARGRSKGIVISIIVFLIYYIFLMIVRYLCDIKGLPPSVGVWIPNLFLMTTCLYLLYMVAKDRHIWIMKIISIDSIFRKRALRTEE
ncbi:LptF/LptG family permease [Thermodesulfobacteriota bacterium]